MLNVNYILRAFKDSVTGTRLRGDWERNDGIIQLAGAQPGFEASCIYLVGAGAPLPANASAEPGTLFVFCDGVDAETPDGACSIFISEPLATVFNAMANASADAERWKAQLENLPRTAEFQAIVSLAAHLGSCPAILLDRRGKALASDLLRKSSIAEKTPASTVVNAKEVRRLLQAIPDEDETIALKIDSDSLLHCRRIAHPDGSCSFLLMEDRNPSRDIEMLCELTARELEKREGESSLEAILDKMGEFSTCWQRIMEAQIGTSAEVRDAISRLPYPVDPFVSIGVVSFPAATGEIPYRDVLLQLRRFFPNENMTLYHKDIVIMLSQKQRSFRPNFREVDVQQLSELLHACGGMLALSGKTRRVDALPTLYGLAKKTALIAATLNDTPAQNRIVYSEDYSIYYMIDLAIKQYLRNAANTDVMYLVHPAIVLLTRYDAENSTNLRTTLYHYLMCDRNLVKTAAATYMHRNTVLNKVNKITKLIQLDLDDARLRQKLILSCQVILYIERALHITLTL